MKGRIRVSLGHREAQAVIRAINALEIMFEGEPMVHADDRADLRAVDRVALRIIRARREAAERCPE